MEEIVSKDNSRIRAYHKLASSRKERQQEGAFVIEGDKLLGEALRCGLEIRRVFATREWLSEPREELLAGLGSTPVSLVDGAARQRLSQFPSPQGVWAICSMLDNPVNPDKMNSNGALLGLWNLQDPGNVGTMIRTADAMGLDGVVLSRECCDLYNMKTLRAAMGSLFRMPVLVTDMEDFLHRYRGQLTSYAAVGGEATPLSEVSFPGRSVILIGNEGNGLSAHQAACCDSRITIPMTGRAESLNAAMAATILMWELSRSRMGKNCPERSNHETN